MWESDYDSKRRFGKVAIDYDTTEGLVSFDVCVGYKEFTPQEMKNTLVKMCEYLETLV